MIHWTHSSKWQKHLSLSKEPSLKLNLPETAMLDFNSLKRFLIKYPFVYLKPIRGTGGFGIIRVTRIGNQYIMETSKIKRTYTDLKVMYRNISRIMNQRKYLIQQGIKMISIDDKPIDFRILILKPSSQWEVMGSMAKLAAKKNKIVTNRSQGGKALRTDGALRKSMHLLDHEIFMLKNDLNSIALKVANTLSKNYRYVREIGMDVAIDTNLNIWILETNSMPRFSLFKYHEDITLYNRIKRHIKHIRRNY